MLTRRYMIYGRVQGVGFRWFVEREAAALALAGWVRNNDDGSVEVLARGSAEQLASLNQKLAEGPRAARVERVDESDATFEGELKNFSIHGAW